MIGSGAFALWKGSYLTAGFVCSPVLFSFTLSFQDLWTNRCSGEKIFLKYSLSSYTFSLLELNIISL